MLKLVETRSIEMNSIEFMDRYLNPCREAAGEAPLRNTRLVAKMLDECPELMGCDFIYTPEDGGAPRKAYKLNYEQMLLIGMRESKSVRRNILKRLRELNEPENMNLLTALNVLLQHHDQLTNTQKMKLQLVESQIQTINSKLDNYKSLSEQLIYGHVPIKSGWEQYCNVVSYDTFKEFAFSYGLPKAKLNYIPDGTVVRVETFQVKVEDLLKLKEHILGLAVQVSARRWTHPSISKRFELRIK